MARNDRLYEAMATKRQGGTALQLRKNMNRTERLLKQARRVRWAVDKLKAGGLTQLVVVSGDQVL